MAFVDDADVQVHLPIDKLKVEEIPDDKLKAFEDAERIVRGYLTGVADMATWLTPSTTPDIIRAITGRFAAALIYRTRYSENSLDDPQFAQNKYQEALNMIMAIINGDLEIPGVDIGFNFDNTMFSPNADTVPGPVFTMGARY